jgi:CpeT protein
MSLSRWAIVAGMVLFQAGARAQSASADSTLAVLAGWMTGSFSSAEQSARDTSYFDIRLHMARIWVDRTDGYWLYVEQATAARTDKPYRQRVYHLTTQDGGYRSDVFTLPDPSRYTGAWREHSLLGALTPDSLIARDGCSILLHWRDGEGFAGGTDGKNCPSDLRGAAYAVSEVTITEAGMVSWDRGYDRDGQQVWGATGGGYIFRKVKDH